MSAFALTGPNPFWHFDGTAAGATSDSAVVPKQYSKFVRSFIGGSATGADRIGWPIQEIYKVQHECSHSNWNGDGAEPISEDTAHQAEKVLLALPSDFPVPDIYGGPSGAIAFEWHRSPRHRLVISIYSNGSIEFAGLLGVDDEVYGVVRMGSSMPRILRENLRYLFAD